MKSEKKQQIDDHLNIIKDCKNLLIEKKAIKTIVLDMYEVHSEFDYFVIAIANSQIHCKSLARDIRKYLFGTGLKELSKPSFDTGWIVLDYEGIVVHIFTESIDEFYQLEKLWADAKYVN